MIYRHAFARLHNPHNRRLDFMLAIFIHLATRLLAFRL